MLYLHLFLQGPLRYIGCASFPRLTAAHEQHRIDRIQE
jgi:hypothetical protein